MKESGRIVELDGLRGMAVLLVLVHHLYTAVLPHGIPRVAKFVHDVAAPFFLSGVDLFFVISGFIVGGIVIDNVQNKGFFRSFYIRRATRILPLYYGMFALFLLANAVHAWYPNPMGLWLLKDNMPLWSYAIFAQNYFMGMAGHAGGKMYGMAWSVATEEHFYLLFPALLWFAGRFRASLVVLSLLVICPIIRASASAYFGNFFAAYVPFPSRADSIAFGVIVALALRNWPERFMQAGFRRVVLATSLAAAVVLVTSSLGLIQLGVQKFSVLALFYSCVLILGVTHHGLLAAFLRNRALVFFGFISYALYMYHQTINGLVHGFGFGQAPRMHTWTDFVATSGAAVVSIALAYLSTKHLESPIRRYGYRITSEVEMTVTNPTAVEQPAVVPEGVVVAQETRA